MLKHNLIYLNAKQVPIRKLLLKVILVAYRGIEPRTPWLKVKCSTDWASKPYGRDSRIWTYEYHSQSVVPYRLAISLYGVNDGTWTHDNQNHNLALYQLNYIHQMVRLKRFELLAHALEGRCSIQLS